MYQLQSTQCDDFNVILDWVGNWVGIKNCACLQNKLSDFEPTTWYACLHNKSCLSCDSIPTSVVMLINRI